MRNMFKVNNRGIRHCSNRSITHCSVVFDVNLEYIWHVVLVEVFFVIVDFEHVNAGP